MPPSNRSRTDWTREPIELIDGQIRSILEREGVEEINTSGEVDPTRHRVVTTVSESDADPGEIVDVCKLGYRLDDRVIREAHVDVAEEEDGLVQRLARRGHGRVRVHSANLRYRRRPAAAISI